ncbi:MAG: amidohydrolase family protein [bacterium]|nr:amidohydrolase family protein [bacterium]MDZ4341442.1 amidohydrolase family protein [Candidatus Binatia bacterium]
MIIDAHTHIGNISQRSGQSVSMTDLLRSMDEAGIDMSLIIADAMDLGDGRQGLSANDLVKQRGENKRLRVIGNVSINRNLKKQLRELGRMAEAGEIVGIKLYPGYEDYYPIDKRLWPVYEFCQLNNLAAVFHTGVLMEGTNGVLQQVHPLKIDEVAVKFPGLCIVMAHLGNPWLLDAAAVILKNKNVYADLSGFFAEFETIKEEDVDRFKQRVKKEFTDFAGNLKKCMFGTDWPLYSQPEYLDAVKALPMSDEERELVLGGNAMKVYGLE